MAMFHGNFSNWQISKCTEWQYNVPKGEFQFLKWQIPNA